MFQSDTLQLGQQRGDIYFQGHNVTTIWSFLFYRSHCTGGKSSLFETYLKKAMTASQNIVPMPTPKQSSTGANE